MTIGELKDRIDQAVENGWEDYPVFVRKFGTSITEQSDVFLFDLINIHAGTDNEVRFGEVIYKEIKENDR